MNPSLSAWMDLSRVVAALVVFFGHARGLGLTASWVDESWHRHADDAVVAFFVISGFVIAWSTQKAGRGIRHYAEARASRIYSVALPAVLVALALDHIGMRFDSSQYDVDWQYPKLWLYLPLHWTFLGGTWIGPMDPFSMKSYWSLPYEVWYYVLFGCATLLKGHARTVGVALTLAFMGPRMWLLLPCWWLGVLLNDHLHRIQIVPRVAWTMMGLSILGYAWFVASGGRAATDAASSALYASFDLWLPSPFTPGGTVHAVSDYLVAALFGIFLVGCSRCGSAFGRRPDAVIRMLAGHTFSLYLIHYSLLVLLVAMGASTDGWLEFTWVITLTAVVTWSLAQIGESRRSGYRRAVGAALDLAMSAGRTLRAAMTSRSG
jgi:peptidoglycan/LPS O-acetylase OafA/YrhL